MYRVTFMTAHNYTSAPFVTCYTETMSDADAAGVATLLRVDDAIVYALSQGAAARTTVDRAGRGSSIKARAIFVRRDAS